MIRTTIRPDADVAVVSPIAASGLVPGSVQARLLYGVFSGQPVQVVDSPPGSGKTTLVIETINALKRRAPFAIVVACPTRRGAYDMAERLAARFGDGPDAPRVRLAVSNTTPPPGCVTDDDAEDRVVEVRTVASCCQAPPVCDVMFIDEAYQVTFAQATAAADGAHQVVLVGDPGQIGPVITQDSTMWDGQRNAPHLRAPEVFSTRDDAVVLQLDASYRLGQTTVDAISALYAFPFTSRRPARALRSATGAPIKEIVARQVDPAPGVGDRATMEAVAEAAAAHVGSVVHTVQAGQRPVKVTLEPEHVAVVVSHNVQATTVASLLRERGLEGITVGTADRMQGGQWHAVVALDPLSGHTQTSTHQVNSGRLCVMVSRHMTHLTWIHDGTSQDKLRAAAAEHPEAAVGIAVRDAITGRKAR